MTDVLLKIGELAARAQVSPRTVDYYTSLGLLSPAKKKDMLAHPDTMETYESALFEDDMSPAADIEVLIAAAKTHGEDSEPDMEPGDLQIFLRTAHAMLDAKQVVAFEADERVKLTLDRGAPAPKR